MIRVLIVDDRPIVRSGVINELTHYGAIEVVGETANLDEIIPCVQTLQPQVILMGLFMPEIIAVQILNKLRSLDNHISHVIILLGDEDPELMIRMYSAGAKGWILRDTCPREIIYGIKMVNGGRTWIPTSVMERFIFATIGLSEEDSGCLLSERELEVLKFASKGMGNKQIAVALNVSERTIAFHFEKISKKLGAKNRTEAVVKAVKYSWITIEDC